MKKKYALIIGIAIAGCIFIFSGNKGNLQDIYERYIVPTIDYIYGN